MNHILNNAQISKAINRLCFEIIENHQNLDNTVIIGLQPRGIFFSNKIVDGLQQILPTIKINYGKLDITFYRDDVRQTLHLANKTDIPFSIEQKNVIIIDDVLFTGRTIRAALDALLDFGRPKKVELCVLIDRRFSREFPIEANYIGRSIDTFNNNKVLVRWDNDIDEGWVSVTNI
ncbi:MAG: bifunctional pyr operon transcriptional regulator/uracil phosphoribosyltransferase PyrR [Chitinophagaceae bacterium]|jgi:pyrimidine operon attenuation protein/uracil phosphoribosyltransferase